VIGFDRSLARGSAAQWLETRGEGARIALRSREMVDLLAAAQSGAGLALLPCFLGDFEPALHRLTREVLVSQPLSLVYRREARLSKEVRAVIRFVSEVIEQHAAALAGDG
jgi:DNA-binding transcriptional LysR family regulator